MGYFFRSWGTRYGSHLALFCATFVLTTLSGAEWSSNASFFYGERPLGWNEWLEGLHFSVPFLTVLSVHEFGHYVAARCYRIAVSLPYYIPLWLGFLGIPSIGTAGAFIRIKSHIRTRDQYFDVGVAGPLAGFCVALLVLWYGFTHLPAVDHVFSIHPEYERYGSEYARFVYTDQGSYLLLGSNLLFDFFKAYVADPSLLPHPYEMIHYPYLLAGYLSLFFTALNLLPIGQLDGGHVLYALVGSRWHGVMARALLLSLLFYAGLGVMQPYVESVYFLVAAPLYVAFLYLSLRRLSTSWKLRLSFALGLFTLQLVMGFFFPSLEGYSGWLLFGFLIGNLLGVDHPVTENTAPLSPVRRYVAYLTILIFVLCFSWEPFLVR